MALSERYRQQVALLLRTIPAIASENCFALKGGTAINLFVRDLPRLSVDIDLTYVTLLPRDRSLGAINKAMKRIQKRLDKSLQNARITQSIHDGTITKLVVREAGVQIKIEVTPVLRGCAYDPEIRTVTSAVEEHFGFAEMKVVSFADLYAGKIVAALDRQHPRDLFDVQNLLANEGVTDEIREAFIVYLISHNRPMSEVLAVRPKNITQEFQNNFEGMTDQSVNLDGLVRARSDITKAIVGGMSKGHRRFLVGFEAGEPDWSLLKVPKAKKLPAVKWRQINYDKLSKNKRIANVRKLAKVLGIDIKPQQLTLFAEPSAKPKRARKPKKKSDK